MRTSGAILADALEIDGCCAQQRGSDFQVKCTQQAP
jgi:hypothetical protein